VDSLLKGLNPQQIEAVTATEGYVRVVAGAGAGKTKALTHRYAWLVSAGGIHPRNILCVTFTNKAAGEMKRRVRALVGDGCDTSLITTYHGFCVRVLRPDMDKLFYPQSFIILDVGDQKKILEEIYEELEIKLDHASFQKILRQISLYKADGNYVSLLTDPSHVFDDDTHLSVDDQIIRRYMKRQKKVFGLDFDDLVHFTFRLFDKHADVREKWQEQLHYIQVDEFQDSSKREMRLLDILCAANENLFVVGDPDQTIYEWRGAKVEILVDFHKSHAETQTIILNQNYRSTPQILNAANSLIAKNKMRIEKDLFTHLSPGSPVIHLHARSEGEETAYITKEIKTLIHSGRKYGDVAILYRASFLSRYIEQAFLQNEIPYQIWGGIRFYDRMEIKDMLAYLRMAARQDDVSFLRVINVPRRQMGKARINALKALAEEENTTLYQALKAHADEPPFRASGAASFVALIEEFSQKALTLTVSELLQNLLAYSGYENFIRAGGDMERLDNLAELARTVTEMERAHGETLPLDALLQHISLQTMDETEEETRDCVKLMTIHAAKGLEFPFVFTVGVNEGVMPSARTLEERKQAGLEEERRLCFVAMTRAMERLYLTESEGLGLSGAKKLPSRFLFDIGEGLYERIGTVSAELLNETRKAAGGGVSPQRLPLAERVKHPLFGNGTVEGVDEGKQVYFVRFDNTGKVKPISLDYNFGAEDSAPAPQTPLPVEADFISAPLPPALNDPHEKKERPAYNINPRDLTTDPAETNLWKRADVPHDGWFCTGITDLGKPVGSCGMCGYQIIRYVHQMSHPTFPRAIGAGCVCAGKMENDPEAAANREREHKKIARNRQSFLQRKWKVSAKGNPYIKLNEKVIVLLQDKFHRDCWKYMVDGRVSGLYRSQEEAMLGAYDFVVK
jgi:DNA helicase-2/ATP-dependent DNA helicase PcrA